MQIRPAADAAAWDDFVARLPWTPFLQSWTMGQVYDEIGQPPVRVEAHDGSRLRAVCYGHVVHAKRGTHLSVPYGPLLDPALTEDEKKTVLCDLMKAAMEEARSEGCSFVRMSPFVSDAKTASFRSALTSGGIRTASSPLHLLAEHVWYLPLLQNGAPRSEEELRAAMRKTTRNLIGRAERDGVTIETAPDWKDGLSHFIRLHDETRKRHKFTPYSNRFFEAQVRLFSERKECTIYLARFQEEIIAASVHMHTFGETSYHHGASSSAHHKVPASYLLQWTAIRDAMKRGDRLYNFWGIAPLDADGNVAKKLHSHPFGGVTLFKTGFGGSVENLMHCTDLPLKPSYWLTNVFERVRKWRRGF